MSKFSCEGTFWWMMRSHRIPLIVAALLSTVLAAGCGSGRNAEAFLPDEPATVASAPPAQSEVPQVVVAGPKQALLDERDAAATDAKDSRAATVAAEARRQAARRTLREERAESRRVSERAAAREEKLKGALLTAREPRSDTGVEPASPQPDRDTADVPITASDTGPDLMAERDRRSDAEARAAVLRFHELLDRRDVRACDLLTEKLLVASYGNEDPLNRCRAAVSSLSSAVGVTIVESRTHGKASSVAVITRIGEQEYPQTMHLVLVNGTWLFDAVERRSAS
ncbi:MAG: hypothetical protein WKF96_02530 [Solirubrobacteraceae bacterium]